MFSVHDNIVLYGGRDLIFGVFLLFLFFAPALRGRERARSVYHLPPRPFCGIINYYESKDREDTSDAGTGTGQKARR